MKVLFINACVREHSRTLSLCHAYIKKRLSEDDVAVHEVSLQKEELVLIDGKALAERDRDIKKQNFSAKLYDDAKAFAAADLILIAAPYWDCSFPALLKIYFENICVNGLTFFYRDDGIPASLCNANKLVYITTSGGYLAKPNSLELYLQELCHLLGIPEMSFYSAQGLDIIGNDVDQIMSKAIESF